MLRKILFSLAALAVIGAAALSVPLIPTASAAVVNHHRHFAWRPAFRFYSPSYGSCYVRQVVHTPFGPRVQWVNVCY